MNKDLYKDESSELEAFGRGLADGVHLSRSRRFKKAQLQQLQVGLGMKRPSIWRQTWVVTASLSAAVLALIAMFTFNYSGPSSSRPQANRIDPQTADRVDDLVTPLAIPEAVPPAPKPKVVGAPAEDKPKVTSDDNKSTDQPRVNNHGNDRSIQPGRNIFNFDRGKSQNHRSWSNRNSGSDRNSARGRD